MRYGYARVSTTEQNLDLQLDALERAECGRIFHDVITGKSRRRPGFDAMMTLLNPGDTVAVWRVDRLGRNFYHLVTVAEELRQRSVHFVSLTEGIDTTTPFGQAIYRFICIVAEMERDNTVARTKAGLAATQSRGTRLGRKPKLTDDLLVEAESLIRSGLSAREASRRIGVGKSTLYRRRGKPESCHEVACADHVSVLPS